MLIKYKKYVQTIFFDIRGYFEISLFEISRVEFTNTVELQWLKQLWNHENMFETGSLS